MSNPKALILLSEARSGTNYLASRLNQTGLFGQLGEWLDLPKPQERGRSEADAFDETVFKKGSSENGVFAIKVFPRHLHHYSRRYGRDFLDQVRVRFDPKLVILERQDSLKQAVSLARALQNDQWTSGSAPKKTAAYDPELISRCAFTIEESFAFWRVYLLMKQMRATHIYYEDLVRNDETLQLCIDGLGIGLEEFPASVTKRQSDQTTKEWLAQFREDAKQMNLVSTHRAQRSANLTGRNFLRLLGGKLQKPYPYLY
ncbi:Stf0 family sulfotransferase [Jannaschia ovalis]|uniref:Stf0 family sulfotransferase n=1 Tax=Jannaschia ovalis TaxID=3038773 RepID=A0ABY8LCK5_9RHOB|nr:Stf0 family sulfotransferase [Jannaschia sp. GRR-S6-38]WGH79057.1 Stf0 family sulfotransferase [Jannaschia sp. GRR-S6-38]